MWNQSNKCNALCLIVTASLCLIPLSSASISFRNIDNGIMASCCKGGEQKQLMNAKNNNRILRLPLAIRGGDSDDIGDFEDSDYDDDDLDDDFFGFNDDADFETIEDDFGEDTTLTRTWESWKKTPPLTKAYLSASIAATGIGYVTNKNQFPSYFLMEWKPTFTKLQIWRPLTAFLNFGPMGIGYLMTGHFVWTYMSTLERLNHDAPYDFWVMIVFGCASMVVGYSLLGVPPTYLGHNLSTFLVYVWSRYHEGLEVNMMELFNTRAELLPWFFLFQVRP